MDWVGFGSKESNISRNEGHSLLLLDGVVLVIRPLQVLDERSIVHIWHACQHHLLANRIFLDLLLGHDVQAEASRMVLSVGHI